PPRAPRSRRHPPDGLASDRARPRRAGACHAAAGVVEWPRGGGRGQWAEATWSKSVFTISLSLRPRPLPGQWRRRRPCRACRPSERLHALAAVDAAVDHVGRTAQALLLAQQLGLEGVGAHRGLTVATVELGEHG